MPSEKARKEKERRASLAKSRRERELTREEQKYFPFELKQAVELIETVATRLEAGDKYDRDLAVGLRGVARAVKGHGKAIASSKAFRSR